MGFAKIMASVLWLNYFNSEDRGSIYLRKLVSDTTTRCYCPGDYRRNIPYSSEIIWKFFAVQKIMCSTNRNERDYKQFCNYRQYRYNWYNHVNGLINTQNSQLFLRNMNLIFPGWSISQYYSLSDMIPIDKNVTCFFSMQIFSKYLVVPTRWL